MRIGRAIFAALLVLATVPVCAQDQGRPRLTLSADDAAMIREKLPGPPLFATAFEEAKSKAEPWLAELPDVPVPADAGGGYTHEQHKRNSYSILNAGLLYQLTGENAYAALAADMLEAYAALYPGLGEHPKKKEQSPGRLFWQSLNEAVFLVTVIQGYDAVYGALSADQRETIESRLLRPLADFLSRGQPGTFDRVHNHGTWAVAAVGMTGYVLGDDNYVEQALFGLAKDGSAGFMKQLDALFSPDGYYSEGPYYQRYAMLPFLLFAQAIERNEPGRDIFGYRDGILLKAVNTTIQLSYNGLFFPINDAIKDKGLDTQELVHGVAIVYGKTGDGGLLSIARYQGHTVLSGDGYRLAQSLEQGGAKPYPFRSMQLSDGPAGDQGALGILRSGDEPGHQAVVFRATAQGMGHGHFDRLAWLFYDNGREILPDYGAARFLNIESKYGGHYLPENSSWAKQTVAHNTLVVDGQSHFAGDWKAGQQVPTEPLYFEAGPNLDIVAARMAGAYEDVVFKRAVALLKSGPLDRPVVLDVLRVESARKHRYDLPLHFKGHVTNISLPLAANTDSLAPLGAANGYQHLWRRAAARGDAGDLFQLTWLEGNRFYTWSAPATAPTEYIFTETGANDPDFNLRREQAVVQRVNSGSRHTFVALLEPHGEYNGSREYTTESASAVNALDFVEQDGAVLVRLATRGGGSAALGLSFDADEHRSHRVESGGTTYEWTGAYRLFEQ